MTELGEFILLLQHARWPSLNDLHSPAIQAGKVPETMDIISGMMAVLTATVSSWRGLFAQRFLLGSVNSLILPAFMCTVSGY